MWAKEWVPLSKRPPHTCITFLFLTHFHFSHTHFSFTLFFIFYFHFEQTNFYFHFQHTNFYIHFLLSCSKHSFLISLSTNRVWPSLSTFTYPKLISNLTFFCHSQHTNSYHHSPLYMSTHKFSRSLFHCLMSSFTFPTLTLISLSISLTSSFSLSVHTLISSFDLHKEFLWKIRRHCCWGILVKLVTHQIWTSIINISYSQYYYEIFDTILYQHTWKK